MPPVSVIPTIFVRVPLVLGSLHCVGAPKWHSLFIVHEYMFTRLVELGMNMIYRDILIVFSLLLSLISLGIIILPLGILLAFLSRP